MNFILLDWLAVIAYLAITQLLGLYFRSRSGRSVDVLRRSWGVEPADS